MKPEQFIVSGGLGFIGSNLSELILSKGHEVHVIDNQSTGCLENLKDHFSNPKLHIHRSDLESFDLNSINKISGFFHLAAQASVPLSIESFFESSVSNTVCSIKVIDFCKNLDIPLIYASSSAIYGNLDFGEELSGSVDLLSPYAADKFFLEIYSDLAYKLYGLPSMGLRFFNVYGPRQDASNPYSGVIAIFMDRLAKGLPITVNGGFQTRDFVFVDDVVKVIWESFKLIKLNRNRDVLNVLTGSSHSINNLVDNLSNILKVTPEIILKDLPKGDPEKSEGSTKQLIKVLGIENLPITNFEDGLRKLYQWTQNNK